MTQTPPPMAPPPATGPIEHGQVKKAAGIATAALVLGICGFIPILGALCGLVGIILGIVALVQQTSRKGLAAAGIITGVVGPCLNVALLLAILLPGIGRSKELAQQAICMSNLNGIYKGMILYGNENDDAYPPDLDALIDIHVVSRKMLQCPSVERHRNCDYFYFPPQDGSAADGKTIVACDFKGNHGGEGRAVLCADGSVKWLTEEAFQSELALPINAAFAAALRSAEGP